MKKEREHTETTEQPIKEQLVFRKPSAPPHKELESSRTTVSFIESGTPARETNASGQTQEKKDTEPVYDNTPKIRRMSDSTRAREAEKNKN